jgi:hypothetical protein
MYININIITFLWVTLYEFLEWILPLLATLTHDWQLHLIIAPSLISTFLKSLAYAKSSSPQCLFTSSLVTSSNSGCSPASRLRFSLNGGSLPIPTFLTTDSRPFHTSLLVFSSPLDCQLTKLRESESESLYDWRFAANRFVLVTSPLRLTTSNFIFQQNTGGYSTYCSTSILSDERMGVLLTIAASPLQRSHSQVRVPQDSWPHFTALDSKLPQPAGPGPHIYISQEQGDSVIPPRHWVPFSSPPTTRRDTVEIFDLASITCTLTKL